MQPCPCHHGNTLWIYHTQLDGARYVCMLPGCAFRAGDSVDLIRTVRGGSYADTLDLIRNELHTLYNARNTIDLSQAKRSLSEYYEQASLARHFTDACWRNLNRGGGAMVKDYLGQFGASIADPVFKVGLCTPDLLAEFHVRDFVDVVPPAGNYLMLTYWSDYHTPNAFQFLSVGKWHLEFWSKALEQNYGFFGLHSVSPKSLELYICDHAVQAMALSSDYSLFRNYLLPVIVPSEMRQPAELNSTPVTRSLRPERTFILQTRTTPVAYVSGLISDFKSARVAYFKVNNLREAIVAGSSEDVVKHCDTNSMDRLSWITAHLKRAYDVGEAVFDRAFIDLKLSIPEKEQVTYRLEDGPLKTAIKKYTLEPIFTIIQGVQFFETENGYDYRKRFKERRDVTNFTYRILQRVTYASTDKSMLFGEARVKGRTFTIECREKELTKGVYLADMINRNALRHGLPAEAKLEDWTMNWKIAAAMLDMHPVAGAHTPTIQGSAYAGWNQQENTYMAPNWVVRGGVVTHGTQYIDLPINLQARPWKGFVDQAEIRHWIDSEDALAVLWRNILARCIITALRPMFGLTRPLFYVLPDDPKIIERELVERVLRAFGKIPEVNISTTGDRRLFESYKLIFKNSIGFPHFFAENQFMSNRTRVRTHLKKLLLATQSDLWIAASPMVSEILSLEQNVYIFPTTGLAPMGELPNENIARFLIPKAIALAQKHYKECQDAYEHNPEPEVFGKWIFREISRP